MLPRVKIVYENGALGAVSPSPDGLLGIVCTAVATTKFELSKPYKLSSLDSLAALGVTEENNAALHKIIREFYAEAGAGTEVYVFGVADTVKMSDMLDVTKPYAKSLVEATNGTLRGIIVSRTPASSYTPTIATGLDSDVFVAIQKGEELATWATDVKLAPLFVMVEGYAYSGNAIDLKDLSQDSHNHVGVLIGDTVADSKNAAVGVLAGRIASIPVQRNIGRVKDGPVNAITLFVGANAAETADVSSIHDKSYITFRTFVGRSGYFFSDDVLASLPSDDYSHLTARRTIDKAYRIAYNALLDELLDEVPVNADGTLQAAMVKSWQGKVETAIANQMTANGELSADSTDARDKGVQCYIDYNQNVLSTSLIKVQLRVRPFGYARMIDVYLGFTTTNV
jgi:hypothetical protein